MTVYTFSMPSAWLDRHIDVLLVGVGGNGSEMLDALARLHLSLKAMGHPHGFRLTAIDPDTIAPSNIVRQRFYEPEIGSNKAVTAIQRYNAYLGLDWMGIDTDLNGYLDDYDFNADLVISCVDSVAARNQIDEFRYDNADMDVLYLDLGNGAYSGQIVLGHLMFNTDGAIILPTVHQLFPEILGGTEDDDGPSCSTEESLLRQNFGINRTMATLAANLLWNLTTQASIDHHGYIVNIRSGVVSPIRIDPDVWSSLAGKDMSNMILSHEE